MRIIPIWQSSGIETHILESSQILGRAWNKSRRKFITCTRIPTTLHTHPWVDRYACEHRVFYCWWGQDKKEKIPRSWAKLERKIFWSIWTQMSAEKFHINRMGGNRRRANIHNLVWGLVRFCFFSPKMQSKFISSDTNHQNFGQVDRSRMSRQWHRRQTLYQQLCIQAPTRWQTGWQSCHKPTQNTNLNKLDIPSLHPQKRLNFMPIVTVRPTSKKVCGPRTGNTYFVVIWDKRVMVGGGVQTHYTHLYHCQSQIYISTHAAHRIRILSRF